MRWLLEIRYFSALLATWPPVTVYLLGVFIINRSEIFIQCPIVDWLALGRLVRKVVALFCAQPQIILSPRSLGRARVAYVGQVQYVALVVRRNSFGPSQRLAGAAASGPPEQWLAQCEQCRRTRKQDTRWGLANGPYARRTGLQGALSRRERRTPERLPAGPRSCCQRCLACGRPQRTPCEAVTRTTGTSDARNSVQLFPTPTPSAQKASPPLPMTPRSFSESLSHSFN